MKEERTTEKWVRLEIRIPADDFEKFMQMAKGSRWTKSEDLEAFLSVMAVKGIQEEWKRREGRDGRQKVGNLG